MADSSQRLPLPRVLAFSGLSVPLSGVGLPIAVFLSPFYAENMGLGVATVGLIFMVLRFWDLLIDPVMGYLVDTRPSRLGRIRHWLLISVPVLGIATFFLYLSPWSSVSAGYLVFWLLIFFTGFTLLQTPTLAWVPAIAPDYDERSRVFMWYEVLNVAALLAFLIIPAMIEGGLKEKVNVMGWLQLVVLPLTVFLAVIFVPDPPLRGSTNSSADFSPAAVKAALSNPPLMRILAAYIFLGTAILGTAATYLWAARWGFGLESGAELVLVVFFLSGMFSMPGWIALSKRKEKHTVVTWICVLTGCSYLLYLPLSALPSFWTMSAAAILTGMGFSAGFTLLRSMLADLVEVELARTGNDRSGLYYALLSGAYKTGGSVAIGIPYVLLGMVVGFDPNGENSPETVRGLMIVFVSVPFAAYLLSAWIIRSYPITREVHARAIAAGDGPAV